MALDPEDISEQIGDEEDDDELPMENVFRQKIAEIGGRFAALRVQEQQQQYGGGRAQRHPSYTDAAMAPAAAFAAQQQQLHIQIQAPLISNFSSVGDVGGVETVKVKNKAKEGEAIEHFEVEEEYFDSALPAESSRKALGTIQRVPSFDHAGGARSLDENSDISSDDAMDWPLHNDSGHGKSVAQIIRDLKASNAHFSANTAEMEAEFMNEINRVTREFKEKNGALNEALREKTQQVASLQDENAQLQNQLREFADYDDKEEMAREISNLRTQMEKLTRGVQSQEESPGALELQDKPPVESKARRLETSTDETEMPATVSKTTIEYPFKNIKTPHNHDVLCDRWDLSNNHSGNKHWRTLVDVNKELYDTVPESQKQVLVNSFISAVRNQDPPGRFLKKNEDTQLWYDVGDVEAQEITLRALRDSKGMVMVEGRLLKGREFDEYCDTHGMCPICGKVQVKDPIKNKTIGIKRDEKGQIIVFEGYHIASSCYSMEEATLELQELRKSTIRNEEKAAHRVVLLSTALLDTTVINDTLKVFMVGAPTKSVVARAIVQGNDEIPRRQGSALCVDVLEWAPSRMALSEHPVKFKIWDVHGGSSDFSEQLLFFSAQSLYILVLDLALWHPQVNLENDATKSRDDIEGVTMEASIQTYIEKQILPWLDCVARFGPKSAILPVVVVPEGMKDDSKVDQMCDRALDLLVQYERQLSFAPVTDAGSISRITHDGAGVIRLREIILEAANAYFVFSHVGNAVPEGAMSVLEAIRRFKQCGLMIVKLITLLDEMGSRFDEDAVLRALYFLSSIGEIIYFSPDGDSGQSVLSRYVVLNSLWLGSALACVLQKDLDQGLEAARQLLSKLDTEDCPLQTRTVDVKEALFGTAVLNCPLLSLNDARLLWTCRDFIRNAAERCETSTTPETLSTMLRFLEEAFVRVGIFMPLKTSLPFSLPLSEVFFVPGCLTEPEYHSDIWSFKCSSRKITLCHSWLIPCRDHCNLMERVTMNVLRGLAEFSRSVWIEPHEETKGLLKESLEDTAGAVRGAIKIHELSCWKSCMTMRVGTVFVDRESGKPRENFAEILVAIAGQTSPYFVGSDILNPDTQRLVVSGVGGSDKHGVTLWEGGYRIVLDSVRASLSKDSYLDCNVVCPECLARLNPREASSWNYHEVEKISATFNPNLRCKFDHDVDSRLLCGNHGATGGSEPTTMAPSRAE